MKIAIYILPTNQKSTKKISCNTKSGCADRTETKKRRGIFSAPFVNSNFD